MSPTDYEKGREPFSVEDVEAYNETEKAIQVKVKVPVSEEFPDGWRRGIWIPKSQIHDDSQVFKKDTSGTLIIPTWLAIAKEFV